MGQAAIQVAKLGGASKVIVTAGTDAKCDLCRTLGADVAVNYRTEKFADVVERETAGAGINLIVDLVGQSYWHANTASAAKEGKIVLVAAMSGSIIDGFDLRALLNKRLWVLATTLRTRDATYQGKLRDKFVEVALENLRTGRMRITVDKVFPWRDISEAHKRMEANTNAGKLICVVE